MTAKKTSPSPRERRGRQAVETFEKGMKALGKRDYEKAREHFDALLGSYPEERDLGERARAFKTLCDRNLDKRPAFRPKGFEELLHHGVYLHNRGEFEEALRFMRQAAEIHPRNEHVLYCLAATSARAGDAGGALKALRGAVAVSPGNRTQARTDSDFDALREDEEFIAIVYPQAVVV